MEHEKAMATSRSRISFSNGKARSITPPRKTKDPKRQNKPWVISYFDQRDKRHQPSFATKGEAQEFIVTLGGELRDGTHTPVRGSITVSEAIQLWLKSSANEVTRGTMRNYRNYAKHLAPLAEDKLARLTLARVEGFRNELLKEMSRHRVRKVIMSLIAAVNEAQRQGLVAQNVARGVKIKPDRKRNLVIGTDVPSKPEIQKLLHHVSPHLRPLLVTAVFTGMRSGELRALTWENIDFERRVIMVRQAADFWGTIGPPKTVAGEREIPMSPMVVNTLEKWKLHCPRRGPRLVFRHAGFHLSESNTYYRIAKFIETHPKISNAEVARELRCSPKTVYEVRQIMPLPQPGQLHFVFSTLTGEMRSQSTICKTFEDLQCRIGMIRAGKPKYTPHKLRHFFASWAIKQGYPPKELQVILGHSRIGTTFDLYIGSPTLRTRMCGLPKASRRFWICNKSPDFATAKPPKSLHG
jgi:integrase